jgi:uncharacterized Zn-binding protein involved in type VI secretion
MQYYILKIEVISIDPDQSCIRRLPGKTTRLFSKHKSSGFDGYLMPGFILHVGATIICPHGGQISATTSNTKVLVDGQPVVTQSDTFTVAGCSFIVPTNKPQPCVMVKWLAASKQVLINGQPALLQDSTGLCQSAEQIAQGPPNVIVTQLKVKGV